MTLTCIFEIRSINIKRSAHHGTDLTSLIFQRNMQLFHFAVERRETQAEIGSDFFFVRIRVVELRFDELPLEIAHRIF